VTEWNAAEYARLSALQAAMAEEVLSLLRERLRGDECVLDVGCGNGKVTREIAALVPHGSVVGVDASAKMIEFSSAANTENRSGSPPLPNLSFAVMDARRLTFREQFDLVVSFNALHWVAEAEQPLALRGICAALKPNGRAQLRLVPRAARKSLEDVIEQTAQGARWKKYFGGVHDPYLHMTAESFSGLAEDCGLRVESVTVKDHAWDFGSTAAFAAFGTVTFVEWSQHVPDPERAEFIADAIANYAPVAGDNHTFRFYQIDITARRG
jgi:trans-aconitate 2-methyltransferase